MDKQKESNPFWIEKLTQIKQQVLRNSSSIKKVQDAQSRSKSQEKYLEDPNATHQVNENLNQSNKGERKGRSLDKKQVTFPSVLETVNEEDDDLERDVTGVMGDSLMNFAIQNAVDNSKLTQSRAD